MTTTPVRTRLLAVITAIAVVGALKLTQPVTLPLAAAIFLLVLAWPLQQRLERLLPRGVAYAVTVLTVLVTLGAFLGAIGWSLSVVAERAPEFIERARELRAGISDLAQERDIPVNNGGDAIGGEAVLPVFTAIWAAGAMLFLTIAFFVLALVEVGDFRRRLIAHFGSGGERALEATREISTKVRGFMFAITLAGLLAGVISLAYGFALGLEHVLVWAFLAYLLNYMPVVGSTIAVFPPTLWALVQFDGMARPLAVLLGFGVIQFVIGNYIAPKFEGRYTSVSPLIVLFSILFWWWVWGPIGAILGVPMTVGILVACAHFPDTRWITALFAESEHD